MKYRFKTKPWPHQVRALKFILGELFTTGSAGLQVPMRWGKSKVATDAAGALHIKFGISRALVVTTTSGLGVWEKEVAKHCPFPVRVIDYQGATVREDDDYVLTFYIIHHAVLYGRDYDWGETSREWKPGPNPAVEEFAPEFIIMDESHRIGDPSSEQCKMAYRYGKGARFRLTLTGTMFHRAPLMVFGQMKFMDDSVFGTAITGFKRMYVRFGGYGNYEIVGYRNLEDMATKLKRKVYVEEYVPHTEPVVTTTPVELQEGLDSYLKMAKESVLTVQGHDITAPIILTKHLRCQQIAGGWLKTPTGKYVKVGQEKQRALTDRLKVMQEEGIDKIVIGARFIPELRDIATAAREAGYGFQALHGGVPRGVARDRRIAAFQEASTPTVFISQIAAGAEAIDLSSAGVMIFYSMPESYLQYAQFRARIERYREKRTLLYDHLIAKVRGYLTRDEVTWFAMQLKKDVAQFLLENPKLVEEITAKDETVYHVGRWQNVQ